VLLAVKNLGYVLWKKDPRGRLPFFQNAKVLQKNMVSKKIIFEKYGIYIFLVALFVFSSLISPAFLTPENIRNIFTPTATLGMVAIGQTFVILIGRGALDLSVAAVMATVTVIVSTNTHGQDALLLPISMVCILLGILVGLANGLLVTKRKVQPFIATMGIMVIVQGLRFLYTKGAPKGTFPPFLRFLGTGNVGPMPVCVISFVVLLIAAAIVLNKTVFGRKIYATGGNINAAIISGYNTDLIIISTYMISGFTAAIAGLYLAGWLGISDNWVGQGYEVDSIAAVVMGGTSFKGGKGGVFGTTAGVIILATLYNLVLLLHLPLQLQYIVKGGAIILATSFYARKATY
jgi:ribose/xylose/arabinose/galactoside ABC-type transport system permease subunit